MITHQNSCIREMTQLKIHTCNYCRTLRGVVGLHDLFALSPHVNCFSDFIIYIDLLDKIVKYDKNECKTIALKLDDDDRKVTIEIGSIEFQYGGYGTDTTFHRTYF